MKKVGLFLGLLLTSLCPAVGQLTVEVILDQDLFLTGETLTAGVRIANRSGQTLRFGADNNWLKLAVESRSGSIVPRKGEVPVTGEFVVRNGEQATRRVELTPWFDLKRPGRYSVRATVSVPEWKKEFTATAVEFSIVAGTPMWEREVGIPRAPGDSNPPELRRYTLHQANYLKKDLMLYVRVSDQTGKLNKVFPVGPLLSFSYPDPQLDARSRLHLLYQSGPRAYSYFVVNTDGDLIVRQKYEITSRPRLAMDEMGNIAVTGGVRHVTAMDLPPPNLADTETNVETPGR